MLPRDFTRVQLAGRRTMCLDALVPGDRMELPTSFDRFLATLGKQTRRNIRYHTRKALEAGMEFVSELTLAEYEAGLMRLNSKTDYPLARHRMARDQRQLALYTNKRMFGLRQSDGKLAAVLCGFTQGTRFHLLTQLNDVRDKRMSLSMVLRGVAIEHLIALGHTGLQFIGGSSLVLGRFCAPHRFRSLIIDKEKGAAALVKSLVSHLAELASPRDRTLSNPVLTLCGSFLEERRRVRPTPRGPLTLVSVQSHGPEK